MTRQRHCRHPVSPYSSLPVPAVPWGGQRQHRVAPDPAPRCPGGGRAGGYLAVEAREAGVQRGLCREQRSSTPLPH